MSYGKKFSKNTDTLSEFMSRVNDCTLACKKMMQYKDNPIGFMRWFEKARLIDRRTTYLYIRDKKDMIPDNCEYIYKSFYEKIDNKYKNSHKRIRKKIGLK